MGLTESNHSKATTGCTGPSKSRSTPHFPDGRGYQNRPRQAATLPARPTPDSGQTPPYHHPRTPVHDPQPMGHDPRPPETEHPRREGSVQVARGPSFHPLAPRRSASADSRKRRSDPLLDSRTLKQLPEIVPLRHEPPSAMSLPQSKVSPPTTPRVSHRSRPTAIYVADDQPTHLVRQREGRARDRGTLGNKPRSAQKAEVRDRSRGSGERKQHTTHVSTFTMTPHCPEDSPLPYGDQVQSVSHQRQKKTRHRSGQRAEFTAPDNPQGDPYVALHYGGTMKDGQRKPIQQVTAWRSDHQEEIPHSPNRQMSRVVIHMNQVSATTLDNYDAVNANIESVQVRRNVWFQASRAIGNTSEPPMVRKISSKAMRTPSICGNTSGYNNSEVIRWPDVTNKVSSVYMRPEMPVAAVSCIREEQEVSFNSSVPSAVSQSNNYGTIPSSGNHCAINLTPEDNTVASMYQVSYNKGSDSTDMNSSNRASQADNICDCGLDYYKSNKKKVESYSSPTKSREKVGAKTQSQITLLPPLEFSGISCIQGSTNGDIKHSSQGNGEEEENMDDHRDKKKMELNFGINNHVEDYTIIEDASNEGHFYGCRDSDYENDESSVTVCHSLLSGMRQVSPEDNQNIPLECSNVSDSTSLLYDKADKDSTTDDIIDYIDSSLRTLRGFEQVPESSLLQESISTNNSNSFCSESVSEQHSDDFYQKQFSLVSDYLSLGETPLCKGEEEHDIFEKAFNAPESSYKTKTVPGSPSALAFSQKCLTQSTSLPRQLHCVSTSDTDMKAFRNRFRSFDLGHFPVLRLPLGNQPRLIDVLRATASHAPEQENIPSQDNPVDEENHSTNIAIHHITSDASSDGVRDPLVSYSDCNSSQHGGREDDIITSGAVSHVSYNSGSQSENNATYDRISVFLCPDMSQVPGNSGNRETEADLSGEGCDEGTVKRGVIPDLAHANSSVLTCDISLPHDGNPTCHDGEGHSKSVSEGTDVKGWVYIEGNEVQAGSSNNWQGDRVTADGGLSSHIVTLRHPERAASSKCLAASPRSASDPSPGSIPDIIPPYNRHGRRKHANRQSLHSIDWDTPLPPVPFNAGAADCDYTCHEQCQDLVTLDCKADLTPDSNTSEEDLLYVDTDQGTLVKHEHLSNQNLSITVQNAEEEEKEEEEDDCQEEQEEKHEEEQQEKELLEEPYRKNEEVSTLRKSVNRLQSHLVDNETLEAWVEKYNATSQGLQIAKENDGSYRGCIRVHLNLSRPINIVAGTRPPSIYDILQEDRTMEKTLTSFYMPRDAVKAIHITSKTTTREVIIALLRKFKVVDNPQKFALYERTYDTGQPGKAKLRRLGDSECPLVLAINWSAGGLTNKRLVLQENDTADIQWEAFSLPELSNFLRILDREEEEYRCQIKDKYALLRRRIGNMLIQHSPSE